MRNTAEGNCRKKKMERTEDADSRRESTNKRHCPQEDSPVEESVIQMKPEDLMADADTPRGEATRRMAILNVDWDSIGANEIYRVISVFARKESIQRVVLYKTKYGVQELEKEEQEGPAVMNLDVNEETQEMELREYLKNKMKYFYAVVELDTAEAGRELYAAVDGLEIEETHNYIDARFIPDDAVISDVVVEETSQLHNTARKIPINPLYSTKPQLKWDEDPIRDRYLRDLFVKEVDLEVANSLIDMSDDEEKQAYYKKAMLESMPEEEAPEEEESALQHSTHKEKAAGSVENEDIRMGDSSADEADESSEAAVLGDDSRFAHENNPDFAVDKTHPAYLAKKRKEKSSKK
ncbi:uncharacterized protein NEMAJ01_0176 [Nematocida major]|uniref:uncharacterized protein n=1 Tax=Nematocida major TaxID=1912982 RepID=UPI002008A404|nr:uncharacterized protein NEMAJ01_0176 [Nematocida major]KAH9385280.1 hypothetical protein NEMAJ01_0176 [Nematocida major]